MEDIPGLPYRIKEYIPAHLQYACIHWATHLRNSMPASKLLDINRLPDGVVGLIGAYEWSKKNIEQGLEEDVPQITNDAYRLVLEFFSALSRRPSEIYHSTFIFAPHCKMTELYANTKATSGTHSAIELVTAQNTTWGTSLRVIEVEGNVSCVEYSPDGSLIVSGFEDGRVQIWDSVVGTPKNTLLGHTYYVSSIAWSPDGRWIVSGSHDKTWRVWNVGSGAEVNQQRVDGEVIMVGWHANGKQIASAVNDRGLQVWDVEIGKAVRAVKTIPDIKRVLTISKDFAHVLYTINDDSNDVVSFDGYPLWLWDTDSGMVVSTMEGHTRYVESAAFLNDTQIVSGGYDDMKVWDIATGRCVHSFGVSSLWISVSSKANRIAASDRNGIRFLDSETWQEYAKLSFHAFPSSFSPNGERLVISSGVSIEIWDLAQLTSEPPTMQPRTINIIFSPKYCSVAIVTNDTITIWSPKPYSGEPSCILHGSFSEHAAFSPDAEMLALIDNEDRVCVWCITTTPPTLLYTISEPRPKAAIAWSLDGGWIAGMRYNYSYNDIRVCVFEAATGRLVKYSAITRNRYEFVHEFSLDSTMIYIRSQQREFLYNFREEQEVDVWPFEWKTNIDRSKFLEQDGWVIRKKDGKQLCWIPASRRFTDYIAARRDSKTAMWQGHDYFGTISGSGQLTLLHIPDSF